ncbi:type II secretion system F family protein [archaeon]|nr:type II secretion system F family protein [archaeon]
MLAKNIQKYFPHLKTRLIQAGMKETTPIRYIQNSLVSALIVDVAFVIIAFLFLLRMEIQPLTSIIIGIPLYLFLFFFFLNRLKVKINKRIKEIDQDIVFAGRFLLIELSAGVPLFSAMVNVARSYKRIGKHFEEIIKRVEVGIPIEEALSQVIDITPSANFRKMMWQVMNSLRTGSDVAKALDSIIDQIQREQLIQIRIYNKKLNPLVMFYLMIAVIVPSLGITIIALLSTLLGINLSLGSLLGIAIAIAFMQFLFYSIIKSSRPGILQND